MQHIMFLRNNKQKIVTDGNPSLCEHGILGSPIECLYVQTQLYRQLLILLLTISFDLFQKETRREKVAYKIILGIPICMSRFKVRF